MNGISNLTDELTNPLVHISHWIKLELLNLEEAKNDIQQRPEITPEQESKTSGGLVSSAKTAI